MLMRAVPPVIFRISNLTGPVMLAVKVAVAKVVVEVVTVEPILVQLPPLAEAVFSVFNGNGARAVSRIKVHS